MSEEVDVQEYLDSAIRHWRDIKKTTLNAGIMALAGFYIDGYQSARVSLFGELLPPDEEEEK